MSDLCARAGISGADFDAVYRDLQDCFAQVYQGFAQEFLRAMFDAFDQEASWREQLRASAYAFLAFLREDPHRAHFTVVEALGAGEPAQLVRDSVFAALFAMIDQGRMQPGAPASLTPATAESVGGGIFGQIRVAVEARRFDELEAMVPEMMYAAVLPYLGPEAAAEELGILPPGADVG